MYTGYSTFYSIKLFKVRYSLTYKQIITMVIKVVTCTLVTCLHVKNFLQTLLILSLSQCV